MSFGKRRAINEAQANFALGLLRQALSISSAVPPSPPPLQGQLATAAAAATSPEAIAAHVTLPLDSMVMSPVSVAIALAMTYAGARNETAAELAQLLAGQGCDERDVHAYFGELLNEIAMASASADEGTLSTANRIYIQQGFPILADYKAAMGRHYRGEFQTLDFGRCVEAAQTINKFVCEATHGRISELVSADCIDPELTRLVLVNAVYFKRAWADKFDPALTRPRPFYVSEVNTKQVEMMCKDRAKFPYYENADVQVLGLPYKGGDGGATKLYVLLPRERFGLSALLSFQQEKLLDGKTLLDWTVRGCEERTGAHVQLPKFKLERTLGLNNMLKALGLRRAFDQRADFSGISRADNLYISSVLQKAFIETNEEGSEAAAATAVICDCSIFSAAPRKPFTFIADHPFLYALVTEPANSGSSYLSMQDRLAHFLFIGVISD